MLKLLFIFFISFLSYESSWATLSCSYVHANSEIDKKTEITNDASKFDYIEKLQYFDFNSKELAQYLDLLNAKYNKFLFSEKVIETLNPNLQDLSFSERVKARFYAFRLNRTLSGLLNESAPETVEFHRLSKKLITLTFLSDPTVTANMTKKEKRVYLAAQHALLVGGLKFFLFEGKPVSNSFASKFFRGFSKVFSEKYMRWSLAWLIMPKLYGTTMPYEIAEKIVWDGLYTTMYRSPYKEYFKPYLSNTENQAKFNLFAISARWAVTATLLVVVPTYGAYELKHLEQVGAEKIKPELMALENGAKTLDQPEYANNLLEKIAYDKYVIEFKTSIGRDPNPTEEIEIHKLLRRQLNIQTDSQK